MKKLFYCACVAALAVSCTNEELIPENTGKVSKGITFETTIEGVAVDSRGELIENGNQYPFFWYAEQDRINVYADNVVAGTDNTSELGVVSNDWRDVVSSFTVSPAVYKATKSASQGQFTAKDDANMLSFANNKGAYFVALYPETTTLYAVSGAGGTGTGANYETTGVEFSIKVAESNASQTVAMNQVAAPMYSSAAGKRNASYESVGEKMTLDFKRPFPVLRFSSADNATELDAIIGNLKSIEVETKGATDAEGYVLNPTSIAATSATYNLKDKTLDLNNSGTNEAIVTLTNQSTWGADDMVYMSIYPVKREGVKGTAKKRMTEKYTVTYTYDHVTLTKELSSSSDWNIENAVYQIPQLNIANDFSWIVTNTDKLYVFKGAFSDIYDEDGDIKWLAGTNGVVDPASITEIISEVALTNAELLTLKDKYTNLTKLTLKANISIPEDMFSVALASRITELSLPLVTSIANTGNADFTALTKLNLKSYPFAEDDIYTKFFNDDVKQTLTDLNIEAVTSLRPTFGYDRTIVFTGYTALENVALNPNGVALTANAFKDCTALKSVTGKVDIANAPSAFENASSGATTHPVINVVNTVIPNAAFKDALIKDIKFGAAQVVPTEIGENAFENNTLIELMDLSKATKIGKLAFKDASAFVGTAASSRNVVTVIAETINEKVFANTAIVRIQFTKANTLGDKVLGGCSALKQVKFLTKVTELVKLTDAPTYAAPFGSTTTTGIDLFVPTTQDDVNGLKWNLVNLTFKSITKENKAWAE